MPPSRSEFPLGTFAAYSPRGKSDVSRKSQQVRDLVKLVRRPLFDRFLEELRDRHQEGCLRHVLGPDVTLVPAPRSAPLVKGALWPALEIANQLVALGLAREVAPILERITPVQKSAFAGIGERPVPGTHYETIAVTDAMLSGSRVTIVDDFVTKGATMLACAWRIEEALPSVPISAFGLVRTMGLQPDVEEIIAPMAGAIFGSLFASNRRDEPE